MLLKFHEFISFQISQISTRSLAYKHCRALVAEKKVTLSQTFAEVIEALDRLCTGDEEEQASRCSVFFILLLQNQMISFTIRFYHF